MGLKPLVSVFVVFACASGAWAQSAPTGTWANETGNQQFQYGGSASDGTYLYLFGGYQYGVSYSYPQYYSATVRYDPVNNYWTTLAYMPVGCYYNAGSYYNGRIFSMGNAFYGNGAIYAYTISTNSWTTLSATLSYPRYYAAACALAGKIYCTGGYYNGYSNLCDEFNPANDTVTARATMPGGTYFASMAGIESLGKAYTFGGYNNGYLSICYEYTPPSSGSPNGSWTTKAPISNGSAQQPRYGPVAVALGIRAYVMGGYNNGYQNTTLEYNPITDTWAQRANMSYQRYLHGGATVGAKAYMYGGYPTYTTCEEFTPPDFGLPPNTPTNVAQTGSRSETALQAQADANQYDGWTNNQISFSANVTDPNAGQQVRLRVRVKNINTATWTNLDSGLTNQGIITLNWPVPADGAYDWQYRVEDSYANSYPLLANQWVDAFDNVTSPDFRSDQVPPADPLANYPSNVDLYVDHPVAGYATLSWTESTDNGPVAGISYEIQVARDGGFVDIEAQIFSTAGTSSYPVQLTVSRFNKYWRLRARDVGGNLSNWSPSLTFRVVYDDHLDHGAGDAKRNCGFSVPAATRSLTGLLYGLALLGLAAAKCRRKLA